MNTHPLFLRVFVCLLLLGVVRSKLYGYYSDESTGNSALLVIDPQTGTVSKVCDLSLLPPLSGGSGSTQMKTGQLNFFYTDEHNGNVVLVKLDVASCSVVLQTVQGLVPGQHEVRDIKYGGADNKLYMVLPDPGCLHGSLDEISPGGVVTSTLTTLVDPEGLSQTSAVSRKENKYYYVGLPFPPVEIVYLLNSIELSSGDSDSFLLINNDLGLGNMWDTNFTLNVWDSSKGAVLIGAVSPSSSSNTTKGCYPSGFYAVDTTNGTVTCVHGPVNYVVAPIAELNVADNVYYQLFTDKQWKYRLVSYDVAKQRVIADVPCDICKGVSVLAYIP